MPNTAGAGIHWQVAQATQISNVYFKMGVGSNSQGIWMENGSGGFISDLVFESPNVDFDPMDGKFVQ